MIFGICSTRGLIIRLACAHKIATRYQHLAALCRPVGAMSFLGLMTAGQCCSDWKSDGRARLVRGSTAGATPPWPPYQFYPRSQRFFIAYAALAPSNVSISRNPRTIAMMARLAGKRSIPMVASGNLAALPNLFWGLRALARFASFVA